MLDTWKIGRPFGVNTYIHWSFWLLPGLILLSGYLSGGLTIAIIDTVVVLAVFACVALHELGHALAARLYHIRTRDIVLYPIGGVARLERMPRNPGAEIVIALAGPAVNLAIVAILAPLMLLDGYGLTGLSYRATALEIFWTKVLWANLGLAIFNLIPAFPMDGGRVLRAVLSRFTDRVQATEIAATVGTGFAVLFGVGGLLGVNLPFLGTMGPMMMVLAVFIYLTGQSELNAVRREETERRRPFRSDFFFATQPATVPVHHADGWEYDPQSRMWTLWRGGAAIKRVATR